MTNLRKYINRGLLAVAGIGAILTLSEAANAASFTVSEITASFSVTVEDKTFYDFSISGNSVEGADTISIIVLPSGAHQLNYNANVPGGSTTLTTGGTLNYKVAIIPSSPYVFEMAGTNAQGDTTMGSFGRTLTPTGLTPATLNFVSTGGTVTGTFAEGLKSIDVTSTWSVAGGSNINGFSDQYVQKLAVPVPEPSAVLGLVALGLVGVLGRSVSKSLHNK